ncbi:MAG: hypothetical protein RIR69_843 [Actinomycetota bacterium]
MTYQITAEKFFDGSSLHGPSKIVCDAGLVVSIDPFSGPAEHFFVSAGCVDLQMNGFAAIDVSSASAEELVALDMELLKRGTTGWLATLITAPLETLLERVQFLDEVYRSGRCPGMLGIHIEGPFLGTAPGAHRPDWIRPIDSTWLTYLPSSVKLITIAPEQDDAPKATQLLTQRNVVVSMGHSRPSAEQISQMISSGAQMVTHLFNGMSGVHHRDPSLALSALVDPRVVCGLIADMSHVSPDAVHLAFAAKGAEGICLVSDTVAWSSERAVRRGITVHNGAPQLKDGTLAGSATPLAVCVQRCVTDAGVSLESAIRSAVSTPASLLGVTEQRSCTPGGDVNLVAFSEDLHVVQTWRRLVSQCAD